MDRRFSSQEKLDNHFSNSRVKQCGTTEDLVAAIKKVKEYEDRCKEEEVPGAEKYRIQDIKINNDIYALAYVSLIDASLLDKSVKDCAPVVQMNKREISNLYLGALLVICF